MIVVKSLGEELSVVHHRLFVAEDNRHVVLRPPMPTEATDESLIFSAVRLRVRECLVNNANVFSVFDSLRRAPEALDEYECVALWGSLQCVDIDAMLPVVLENVEPSLPTIEQHIVHRGILFLFVDGNANDVVLGTSIPCHNLHRGNDHLCLGWVGEIARFHDPPLLKEVPDTGVAGRNFGNDCLVDVSPILFLRLDIFEQSVRLYESAVGGSRSLEDEDISLDQHVDVCKPSFAKNGAHDTELVRSVVAFVDDDESVVQILERLSVFLETISVHDVFVEHRREARLCLFNPFVVGHSGDDKDLGHKKPTRCQLVLCSLSPFSQHKVVCYPEECTSLSPLHRRTESHDALVLGKGIDNLISDHLLW
tara:strand:+ start:18811 stop:19908 length:1098 start_codon:yes stop_codon:yes gene_type:complete